MSKSSDDGTDGGRAPFRPKLARRLSAQRTLGMVPAKTVSAVGRHTGHHYCPTCGRKRKVCTCHARD